MGAAKEARKSKAGGKEQQGRAERSRASVKCWLARGRGECG